MSKGPLSKHTVNLRAGDYAFLKQFCVDKNIDASDIVQRSVSNTVDRLRAKLAETETAPAEQLELKL